MSFRAFKAEVQAQADKIFKAKEIYRLQVSGEELWDTYLNSFDESVRQEFNCSACRHFIKRYGGLATINADLQVFTLWSFVSKDDECKQVVLDMLNLLADKPIAERFIPTTQAVGVDFNTTDEGVVWRHLHVKFPSAVDIKSKVLAGKYENEVRNKRSTFKRAVNEISTAAIVKTRQLIEANRLHRGQQFLSAVKKLEETQAAYHALDTQAQELYVWYQCEKNPTSLIRNSSIGTLLVNLSTCDVNDEQAVNKAIRSYETVMGTYQRPQGTVSVNAMDKAKELVAGSGLMDSLLRRLATPADLDVNNMLFTRPSTNMVDVFEKIKGELAVDVKKLKVSAKFTLEEFILNVVPTAKSMEILFKHENQNNLVTLVTASDPTAQNILKWDNSFSWTYAGGQADSGIRARVVKAGGSVKGVMRFSLAWEDGTDLDLHVFEPLGEHIYYRSDCRVSRHTGGALDVDAQAHTRVAHPVENIIYPYAERLVDGKYRVEINCYQKRDETRNFTLQVEIGGKVADIHYNEPMSTGKTIKAVTVEVKDGIPLFDFEIAALAFSDSQYWGLTSSRFYKVKHLMSSPNYWGQNKVGNEQLFFIIDEAKAEGELRPFYNEQLKSELLDGGLKRAFEALASNIPVDKAGDQVSGLGYSVSTRDTVTLKVNERIIEVAI